MDMEENQSETRTALVTGADRGLGLALAAGLAELGWRVFAGQYLEDWPELGQLAERFPGQVTLLPLDVSSIESVYAAADQLRGQAGSLDLMVNNAAVIADATMRRTIREAQAYDDLQRMYNINALGPLRVVEAFLPLMAASAVKRLCFVSSEAGCISRAQRTSWFGYLMSKAALNMAVKILFNDLRPQGFSFRLYHPGYVRTYIHGYKNMEADLEPEAAAAPALAYFLSGLESSGVEQATYDEDQLVMRDYQGEEWPW
jgi:NAD(P)-dependent dehydrogenase (short-subunit alcohol dehydrogenase family)